MRAAASGKVLAMRGIKLNLSVVSAAAFAALMACSSPVNAKDAPTAAPMEIGRGERVAMLRCSGCHAISRTDQSEHASALPFRELSQSYPLEGLRDTLAEGLIVDHPDMPVFRLSLDEVDALIDYLEEIQATQTALQGQSVQVLN